MGESRVDCGGFWLPPEFLTDKDMDKENLNKNGLNSNTAFGSFGLTRSLGESVTESSSEEDDFLAGLTRQFTRSTLQETHKIPYPLPQKAHSQKTWVMSVSPPSTLTPPASGTRTMPFKALLPPRNDVAWDMVFPAAAGQMNGLKFKNGGPVAPTHIHHWPNPNINVYNNNTHHENPRRGCVAWPPVKFQNRQQQVVYHQNQQRSGGGAFGHVVKRECAGTGVFLPRIYTPSSDSRRKLGSAAVVFPRAQVACKNFENIMTTQAQPHHQFNGGVVNPEYELVMVQRDAQLAQQRWSKMMRAEGVAINQETRLPQEWTY